MSTIKLRNLVALLIALAALGLVSFSPLPAPAKAAGDNEPGAPHDAGGPGTVLERLDRARGGRPAGWPTVEQAAVEFKILRASEAFAPAAMLPHAESGEQVERVRRVLAPAFELHGGGSTLVITVLHTPSLVFGIGRGAVVVTSTGTLNVLDDKSLLAVGLHEIGHQYFRRAYIAAEDAGDKKALRAIELKCDTIAALSLQALGRDPRDLITALHWLLDPSRSMTLFGDTSTHPDLKTRKRLVEQIAP